MENKKEKQLEERYAIAKLLADNFEHGEYSDGYFEWCAFQLLEAGYRKQSDAAKEILEDFEKQVAECDCFDKVFEEFVQLTVAGLKKKYTGET